MAASIRITAVAALGVGLASLSGAYVATSAHAPPRQPAAGGARSAAPAGISPVLRISRSPLPVPAVRLISWHGSRAPWLEVDVPGRGRGPGALESAWQGIMVIGRYDRWARLHGLREIDGWVMARHGAVVGSGRLDRLRPPVNATQPAVVRRTLVAHLQRLGVRLTSVVLERFSVGYTPVMVGETASPSRLLRSHIRAILGRLSPEGWALKVTDPAGATIFFTGRSSFVGVGMTWIAPWIHPHRG